MGNTPTLESSNKFLNNMPLNIVMYNFERFSKLCIRYISEQCFYIHSVWVVQCGRSVCLRSIMKVLYGYEPLRSFCQVLIMLMEMYHAMDVFMKGFMSFVCYRYVSSKCFEHVLIIVLN